MSRLLTTLRALSFLLLSFLFEPQAASKSFISEEKEPFLHQSLSSQSSSSSSAPISQFSSGAAVSVPFSPAKCAALYFYHVPNCGGTTVVHMLRKATRQTDQFVNLNMIFESKREGNGSSSFILNNGHWDPFPGDEMPSIWRLRGLPPFAALISASEEPLENWWFKEVSRSSFKRNNTSTTTGKSAAANAAAAAAALAPWKRLRSLLLRPIDPWLPFVVHHHHDVPGLHVAEGRLVAPLRRFLAHNRKGNQPSAGEILSPNADTGGAASFLKVRGPVLHPKAMGGCRLVTATVLRDPIGFALALARYHVFSPAQRRDQRHKLGAERAADIGGDGTNITESEEKAPGSGGGFVGIGGAHLKRDNVVFVPESVLALQNPICVYLLHNRWGDTRPGIGAEQRRRAAVGEGDDEGEDLGPAVKAEAPRRARRTSAKGEVALNAPEGQQEERDTGGIAARKNENTEATSAYSCHAEEARAVLSHFDAVGDLSASGGRGLDVFWECLASIMPLHQAALRVAHRDQNQEGAPNVLKLPQLNAGGRAALVSMQFRSSVDVARVKASTAVDAGLLKEYGGTCRR